MGSFGKHSPTTYLKMVLVLAKLRMGPRTMSMPRSSEALSWKGVVWKRIPASQSTPSHLFPSQPTPSHLVPLHPIPSPLTSSTMEPNSRSRYSCRAQARMVDVFPVPGGP